MTKECYWCHKYMGEKNGNSEGGVFQSICGNCADKMKLEERLPTILWAIADLRKQNSNEQYQRLGVLATTEYLAEAVIAS
ncbi:hypothetical protein ACFLWD_03655 [Chloroflexota bacterium]